MTDVSVTLRSPSLYSSEGHTKLYKFGWHTSANNARMKNSGDLILGKVVYIAITVPIVSKILVFIYWMVTMFGFDHITDENRKLREAIHKITRGHQLSLNGADLL